VPVGHPASAVVGVKPGAAVPAIFRGGHALRLGLRRTPALAELAQLPGIASVEEVDGFVRVFTREGQDPSEAIVRASVERDWGLHYLAPEATSLEDVFVQLTTAEQGA